MSAGEWSRIHLDLIKPFLTNNHRLISKVKQRQDFIWRVSVYSFSRSSPLSTWSTPCNCVISDTMFFTFQPCASPDDRAMQWVSTLVTEDTEQRRKRTCAYLSGGIWPHCGRSERGSWAERDASWPPQREQPSQLPLCSWATTRRSTLLTRWSELLWILLKIQDHTQGIQQDNKIQTLREVTEIYANSRKGSEPHVPYRQLSDTV